MKAKYFIVLCALLIGCTQVKQYQMEKDAQEYLELIGKAGKSGTFGESENGFVALLNIGLDADVNMKRQSILQKYQGDDLLEFSKVLKTEWKKKTGEDIPDLILLMLLNQN
ncbi:MAG: hypothetical protein LBN93_05305 [Candidatus Symbiothrix sp.]|nr:hypothetical protein [Candidatus Symbiothrix sp.]